MSEIPFIPAFPALKYQCVGDGEELGEYPSDSGMSLRDYFAGQALVGMIANVKVMDSMVKEACEIKRDIGILFAQDCYRYADAMLSQRKGSP